MTVNEAIQWTVINGNNYAQAYAKEAVRSWDKWNLSAQRTQVLYMLGNMSHCRSAGVREAKEAIRNFLKET